MPKDNEKDSGGEALQDLEFLRMVLASRGWPASDPIYSQPWREKIKVRRPSRVEP
jgi:hypothetical protein